MRSFPLPAVTAVRPLALSILLCGCAATTRPPASPTDSTLRTNPTLNLRLHVDPETTIVTGHAELAGLDGPVTLAMAERYAFARVEPRIHDAIEAQGTDGEPLALERTDAYHWTLTPDADGAAFLTWSVRLDHREQPAVISQSDAYEHPYVTPDHGMLSTAALLPLPDVDELAARVQFDLPSGWDVIAPWREVEPGTYAPDARGLADDLIAIGSWKRVDGNAGGLRYTIALAPGQRELESLVTDTIPRIVQAEVELFDGAPQPAYLFLFSDIEDARGFGGSPKSNSMTLYVASEGSGPNVRESLAHLVGHEYHHTWMRARCSPEDELRFIAEGVTDYYAYLVMWRLGFLKDAGFRRTLEGKLAEAHRALIGFDRTLPDAGGPAFFAGGDAYDACYAGGLAIGLWLDLAMRTNTVRDPNLDAFMRRFYNGDQWKSGTRPTLDHLMIQLRADVAPSAAAALDHALSSTGGIDWVELFGAIGVDLDRTEAPIQGGPRANYDGTTVTAIDPMGAGAAVGLRSGDRIVSVNGREVASGNEVRGAWGELEGPRMRVTWQRDGERKQFEGTPPTSVRFSLPAATLDALRP